MTRARSAVLSSGGGVSQGTYVLCTLHAASIVQCKSLYVRNGGSSSSGFDLYVRSQPGGHLVGLRVGQVAAGASERMDYWVILDELDELVADIGANTLSWRISGSVLEGGIDATQRAIADLFS